MRNAGGLKWRKNKNTSLQREMFSVMFIRYEKTGKGITNWKSADFFSRLSPSASNTDFVLWCQMTYPGKYLIGLLYSPARTCAEASFISCNNSFLCLRQAFLYVYCQHSWGSVSNPRNRANLAPLQFLLQMSEKDARCVFFFPEGLKTFSITSFVA